MKQHLGARARVDGSQVISPRLLTLREAGQYLSISEWTVRDWVLAGRIPALQLPPRRPREGDRPRQALRGVRVDKADLDAFIASLKDGAPDVQSGAQRNAPANTRGNTAAVPAVCPSGGR